MFPRRKRGRLHRKRSTSASLRIEEESPAFGEDTGELGEVSPGRRHHEQLDRLLELLLCLLFPGEASASPPRSSPCTRDSGSMRSLLLAGRSRFSLPPVRREDTHIRWIHLDSDQSLWQASRKQKLVLNDPRFAWLQRLVYAERERWRLGPKKLYTFSFSWLSSFST